MGAAALLCAADGGSCAGRAAPPFAGWNAGVPWEMLDVYAIRQKAPCGRAAGPLVLLCRPGRCPVLRMTRLRRHPLPSRGIGGAWR